MNNNRLPRLFGTACFRRRDSFFPQILFVPSTDLFLYIETPQMHILTFSDCQ